MKTSLAPGSRVVTDYLDKSGLQKYLDQLGFQLVAYGCTTCIGNSGPLEERIEKAIKEYDLVAASVFSGNRNFEARIHGAVKANFLMSPPLVVAFAIAGRVDIDLAKEPLGIRSDGTACLLQRYLADLRRDPAGDPTNASSLRCSKAVCAYHARQSRLAKDRNNEGCAVSLGPEKHLYSETSLF